MFNKVGEQDARYDLKAMVPSKQLNSIQVDVRLHLANWSLSFDKAE